MIRSSKEYLFYLELFALRKHQSVVQRRKFLDYWCQKTLSIELDFKQRAIELMNHQPKSLKHQVAKFQKEVEGMKERNSELETTIESLKQSITNHQS